MQFQFITLDETKSQTKVRGNIYLFDFWFILIYFAVSGMLGNAVSETLRIPFYILQLYGLRQKADLTKEEEITRQ